MCPMELYKNDIDIGEPGLRTKTLTAGSWSWRKSDVAQSRMGREFENVDVRFWCFVMDWG